MNIFEIIAENIIPSVDDFTIQGRFGGEFDVYDETGKHMGRYKDEASAKKAINKHIDDLKTSAHKGSKLKSRREFIKHVRWASIIYGAINLGVEYLKHLNELDQIETWLERSSKSNDASYAARERERAKLEMVAISRAFREAIWLAIGSVGAGLLTASLVRKIPKLVKDKSWKLLGFSIAARSVWALLIIAIYEGALWLTAWIIGRYAEDLGSELYDATLKAHSEDIPLTYALHKEVEQGKKQVATFNPEKVKRVIQAGVEKGKLDQSVADKTIARLEDESLPIMA